MEGAEGIIRISLFCQIVTVEILDLTIEYIVANAAVIHMSIVLVNMFNRRTEKADHIST